MFQQVEYFKQRPKTMVFVGLMLLFFTVAIVKFGGIEQWWLESAEIYNESLQQSNSSDSQDNSNAISVVKWSVGESQSTLKALDWTNWYHRILRESTASEEDFSILPPWHRVELNFAMSTVQVQVRYDSVKDAYFVQSGKSFYEVSSDALWFNAYLLEPEMDQLYLQAGPPDLFVHHQGPKGQLNLKLRPQQMDWFFYNARRLGQRYLQGSATKSTTEASSESLILQSVDSALPQVTLLEADALLLSGLNEYTDVAIEAFSFDQTNQSLGPIPYEATSGHITPLMRPGTVRYSVTLTKKPSGSGIGEGYGRTVYDFLVNLELNPIVASSKLNQSPGGVFMVAVNNVPEGATPVLQQTLMPRVKWHLVKEQPRSFVAFIPLNYEVKKGNYPYKVTLSFSGGQKSTWKSTGQFTVGERNFKVQQLTVDKNVETATRTDAAYAEYNRLFVPARDKSHPTPLWEGPFIEPVKGRLTTEWGTRRSVNGSMTTYRHNGVDLAAPEGTPVVASNTGNVIFAKKLILTGNSIIVDHGLGIFSVYLHLSTMNVKEGQTVKKGEKIAGVGSTGFSTGPHLHFTLSHHKTALDPLSIYLWDGDLKTESGE